jgi:hypothetical protein
MIRQSGDRGEHKNRHKRAADEASTRFEKRDPMAFAPDVLIDDEIDPADFFDPEEFGIRRRDMHSRP